MAHLAPDHLLRALDQLPVLLLHSDAPTGELVIAHVSAGGREFFGAHVVPGQPAADALTGLSAPAWAALREAYQTGQPAHLTAVRPGRAPAADTGLFFRVEAVRDPAGLMEGLLLTGLPPAAASPAPTVPIAPALPLITSRSSADGRRTEYLSPHWFAYTGQNPADYDPATAWSGALHPDDSAALAFTFGPALEARQAWSGEVRLRRHDGQYRWFLSQAVPEFDAAGRLRGWQGLSLDIHERHLAQEQLRRREAQVSFLVETIPQLVWTADAHGGMSWVSEQWTRYTGLRLAQSLGSGWTSALHPDDLRATYGYWAATIAAGTDADIEFRLREDGTGHYRWFVMRAHAQHDERGRSTGWFGTATDVHELREARTQLETKDQLLSQILGQTPALIATVNGPEHRFTFVNAAYEQLMGPRPRLGRPVAECLPPAVAPGLVALLDKVYGAGRPHQSPETAVELPGPDGRPRQHYLSFSFQPLRDGPGRTTGILALGVDVTEQVRARQQAAELQMALRTQDERLHAMTEALPQITYIASRTAGIEYVSPQWYAYTGLPPGTPISGDSWLSFVHPDDLARVQTELDQNQTGTAPWHYELRLRRHDGQYRWHQSQGVPEPNPGSDADALPQRWFGSDIDIHELRELQEELRRGQARYQGLTNKIPRHVWTSGADGSVDFYNERTAAYFGRGMSQLAPSEWLLMVHPDDRDQASARWQQAVATSQPYAAEFRLRRHDGQYRWFRAEAAPDLDEQGQVRRWYGTNTDIQEQRELEQTLHRSEEQFRFLAESLPQIIWTSADGQGNDYVNQHWFDYTGLDPALTGEHLDWRAVIHPDDLALTNARWAEAVATDDFFEVEYRFRRHDGQYRWFRGQGRAQRRPDGSLLKWFGICTDIDDQKQIQQLLQTQNQQLRRTNADLDQFVYTASHDLRQPINNMAGIFEELTRTAYFRDPDAVLLIAMFEKALAQIDDTIRELTAVARVPRQPQPGPLAAVALAPLAAEVIGSLQDQITALGAEITLDFAACPALPFVRAQLQSVLLNLLSNALRYAVPGRPPRVHVSTELAKADQHPILTVRDNGRGIDLARHGGELFQLFRRFHPEVEGSGMGLYLVSRVVESHGGRLEVESEVDAGTVFRVHLPAG